MQVRKMIAGALCAMFLFSSVASAAAVDSSTIQGRLSTVESVMYGTEQTGALMDRLNRLEKDYEGTHPAGNLAERVDLLYGEVFENGGTPSALTRMNAIEWAITRSVSMDSIKDRIANMEKTIQGAPREGTYKDRMAALSGAAFGSSSVPLVQTTVPANTLIKISLVSPVNAKNIKAGDAIKYQVAADVVENGMLVFAKGAPGEGTVTKVTQARNFGRDAEVQIDFKQTRAVDGTVVETFLGEEAKKEMKSMTMAAGASLAGMVILGPVGIVTGAFVHGKNIDLPAGTEMYIQTKTDMTLYGIRTSAQ